MISSFVPVYTAAHSRKEDSTLDNPLISVVVPAYNQPLYLKRAVQSLISQSYRPIELIISDDSSPTSLEPVVTEAIEYCQNNIRIQFFRQKRNLGVMGNFKFCVDHCSGKYLAPFSHDLRITDKNYFQSAISVMQSYHDCYLSIANCAYEGTNRRMLGSMDGSASDWKIMNGGDFICRYRRGGLNWSQATILDHEIGNSLGAYDEPFMVSPRLSRELNIAQDNLFSFVFLLSAKGSVAVTQQCVCEVGMPANSYSRSKIWQDSKKRVKFFIFFNIAHANLRGQHSAVVKKCAYRQALEYVDYIRDRRLVAYYDWRINFLLLLGLSFLKIPWFHLRQFVKRVKRLIGKNETIKKKEFSSMSKSKSYIKRPQLRN